MECFAGRSRTLNSFLFFKCADLLASEMLPSISYKMLGKVAIRLARTQQFGSKRTKLIVPLLPLTYNNRKEEESFRGRQCQAVGSLFNRKIFFVSMLGRSSSTKAGKCVGWPQNKETPISTDGWCNQLIERNVAC